MVFATAVGIATAWIGRDLDIPGLPLCNVIEFVGTVRIAKILIGGNSGHPRSTILRYHGARVGFACFGRNGGLKLALRLIILTLD